jgi:hypothetical protein
MRTRRSYPTEYPGTAPTRFPSTSTAATKRGVTRRAPQPVAITLHPHFVEIMTLFRTRNRTRRRMGNGYDGEEEEGLKEEAEEVIQIATRNGRDSTRPPRTLPRTKRTGRTRMASWLI